MPREELVDETAGVEAPRGAEGPAPIDSRLPRWNQGVLTAVLLIAFVLDFWYAVPVMAVVLGLGTAFGPKGNPVMLFFVRVLRPRLSPPSSVEDPRPPRFASLVGTIFLLGSSIAFGLGAPAVGWLLALIVAVLAGLATTTGFCLGCEIYVLFRRQFGSFNGPWRIAVSSEAAPEPSQ